MNATLDIEPKLGAGSDDVGYGCSALELDEVTGRVELTKLLVYGTLSPPSVRYSTACHVWKGTSVHPKVVKTFSPPVKRRVPQYGYRALVLIRC